MPLLVAVRLLRVCSELREVCHEVRADWRLGSARLGLTD